MEQEALDFVYALQKLYLEQRDMEHILGAIDEHTSWIGTGQHEICENFSEAAQALFADRAEFQGSFTVTNSRYRTELLPPNACVVYGEFWADADDPTADMASLYHRVSAVCAKTPDGMKLLHLHMSRPDDDQRGEEYFVTNKTKTDNRTLRARFEQTAKTLHSREREMESLTANIPGGVHQTKNDAGLTILSMSSGFLDLFGYTRQEIATLFDNQYYNMICEQDRARFTAELANQLSWGQTVEFEYRVLCKSGKLLWILDRGRLVTDEEGNESFFCMMMDITERKSEAERLRLALERHRVILDQATDIIFEWNIAEDTLDFSANWEKKFGYPPITEGISRNIPLSTNIHIDDMPAFVKIMRDTAAGVPYSETEFRIRGVSDVYAWCRIRATAQFDSNGRPIKAVGVIVDIDEEKNRSISLLEAAQCDALTNLLNTNATKSKIGHILDSRSDGDAIHALMMIDVDNFKSINDRFGHQCGDAVLTSMAEALKKLFRSTDVIGRVGGDEFLVFMSNLNGRELAAEKAQDVVEIFRGLPIGVSTALSCSVGVALYPQDGTDYAGLARCADSALYQVKNSGKVDFAFFEKKMRESVPDSIVRTVINETAAETDRLGERLMQDAFGVLYGSNDLNAAINRILETVGRAYDVSRVYVFETAADGASCSNTFEWCNEGIAAERENMQNLSFATDLPGFFDVHDTQGVFYCQDVTRLSPSLRNIMVSQGIVATLHCTIQDDGIFKGFVGFDECKENRYWTKEQLHTLTLIASVLSTFLVKARLKEQLAALLSEHKN